MGAKPFVGTNVFVYPLANDAIKNGIVENTLFDHPCVRAQ